MSYIQEIFESWLYYQTDLKKTLRWSRYVNYENGKPKRYNGIRRQNVLDHTVSKLHAFCMILPLIQGTIKEGADFNLLWSCILFHDFGEGLLKTKFDILADQKVHTDDLHEYQLTMKFFEDRTNLKNSVILNHIEKSFLLQFALTSYKVFPLKARKIMSQIRKSRVERNTAILFQILEKWEYNFYAYEHRFKHPTILKDVSENNIHLIENWISKLPKKYTCSLKEIFLV